MKNFQIPITYETSGYAIVKANTLEEAIELANSMHKGDLDISLNEEINTDSIKIESDRYYIEQENLYVLDR